ncbi:unnamed protein product, partial [Iphiclides podalirius]
MSVAVRSSFWVLIFGTLGYGLFKVVKPDNELLEKFDQESKHTDTRKFSRDTIAVLKESTNPDSEISKKIDNLLKK